MVNADLQSVAEILIKESLIENPATGIKCLNLRGLVGKVSLHIAISKGNSDLIPLIGPNKSPLNEEDNKGMVPLHHTAEIGNNEAVTRSRS
jgi:ankyrin repeat protein